MVDFYPKYTDRDIRGHGVEFPAWSEHFGAGRISHAATMEHKTSQFSLFKLMYERAMIDKRRTLDPADATTFLIPYDIGMNACFTMPHGRMRKTGCPQAHEVERRLLASPFFKANHGHDHVLIVSVNQNMNYFFERTNCTVLFQTCWNCTKLSIDEYLFTAQDRTFETRGRGINWHAVPFPSDYHFSARLAPEGAIAPWDDVAGRRRRHVVSFSGSPNRLSKISTQIRHGLLALCRAANDTRICATQRYDTGTKRGGSAHTLSRESIFCLQPPGDMPTRKAVFDAILSGCIIVLFHPLTAKYMYDMHLSEEEWDSISISYDSIVKIRDVIKGVNGTTNVIKDLVDMQRLYPSRVRTMQESIRKVAFKLQYSLIELRPDGLRELARKKNIGRGAHGDGFMDDAYDIAINRVMEIHSGAGSHARQNSYVECAVMRRGRYRPQTADWCTVLGTKEDPYTPPMLVTYAHPNVLSQPPPPPPPSSS